MNEPQKTQGSIIQKYRTQRDQSLRDFAAELNVSHNTITLYEQDEIEVSSDRLDQWVSSKIDWISQMAVELYWLKKQSSIAKFMQVVGNTDPAAQS